MPKIINIPFKRNIGIKLLALFFSIFLWLYVVMEKDYIASFELPLELINSPKNLLPSRPYPSKVTVRFDGKGKQLVGLKYFASAKVMVDIFGTRPGKRTIVLSNSDVFIGGTKVKVLAIEAPQTIEIHFDYARTKSVPVTSRAVFIPSDGFVRVGQPEIKPQRAVIKGPRREIAMIETVYTQDTEFADLSSDTTAVVGIDPPNGFNVTCPLKAVLVMVSVQKVIEKELSNVPVLISNLPPDVTAKLDRPTISLTIVGGVKLVNNFNPNDLKVFVAYREFSNANEEIEPTIVKFKDVKIKDLEPKKLRLIVQKKTVPSPASRGR